MSATVLFRTVSPMLFRSPGEFQPEAKGPLAIAKTLLLPTPSTIAGCLATSSLYAKDIPSPVFPQKGWESDVCEVLRLGEGYLRGPYLFVGNEVWFQTMRATFVRARDLPQYIELSIKKENKEKERKLKMLEREPIVIQRLGIGLKEGKKVADAERGLIYTANFIDYSASFGQTEVMIAVDAEGWSPPRCGRIVRLGGEGRAAILETIENPRLRLIVNEFLDNPTSQLYLYLVSPSLFAPPNPQVERVGEGAFVWPGIEKKIRELVDGLTVEKVYGFVSPLGAGFALAGKPRRKPIYMSLEPGSFLKVRADDPSVIKELYQKGLTEYGSKLGYGTFVPVRCEKVEK